MFSDSPKIKLIKQVFKNKIHGRVDWLMFVFILPILGAGLITMNSFLPAESGIGGGSYFSHQLIWVAVSFTVFFILSFSDLRFLKRTDVLTALFSFFSFLLILLFFLGKAFKGAQSWFSVGGFTFQPSDFIKVILILILAKYFSRRHIEIAHPRHIFISGLYAFIPFALVLFQPDFGSAMIIFLIWLGITLVSGISKRHFLMIFIVGALSFTVLWSFVFAPYQKARIISFLHPLADTQGAGYSAYQSTIAIGSGQIFGKGVGYGTQSRLQFLPEYQTDFIFAAFAEEWGFVGVLLLFILFILFFWRVLLNAQLGSTNFEMLYGMGVSIFLISHIIVNIGMNVGILPVTGVTLPFMSYGGIFSVGNFNEHATLRSSDA